jgi:hypothetical protein
MRFCIYQEPPFYIAQGLDLDVSTFGGTIDEALANFREAVALYLEDEPPES